MIAFDPAIHHRQSIRLKGHDYSGPGLYFVTICAHREFIEWAKGNPFGAAVARPASPSNQRATQVSPVRELIEERMQITAEKCPFMKWEEAVIMPDHVHALIRMQGGDERLGDVIGGFKAAVTRELRRRRGEARRAPSLARFAPPPDIRIWHRNYYDMIVRTPEAERNIRGYIRMNPWKLVQHATHDGQAFRMIGNPALLNRERIAVLCSRNCPPDVLAAATRHAQNAGPQHCFIGGFHSPPEQAILAALLRSKGDMRVAPTVICCPAWGIDEMRIPQEWLPALEANRMLILEMRDRQGDLAAAEARNRFVLEFAEKRWLPHITPGGMLERLTRRKGDTRVARGQREGVSA